MVDMHAWPEAIDHLGRVLPGRTVAELVADRHQWTPHEVVSILSRIHGEDAHAARKAVVEAAWSVGITHGPPDLAGRRSRIMV